ncbi:hypothetical protein ACWD0Z_13435 [Streptomyces sp. NPDC003007]
MSTTLLATAVITFCGGVSMRPAASPSSRSRLGEEFVLVFG